MASERNRNGATSPQDELIATTAEATTAETAPADVKTGAHARERGRSPVHVANELRVGPGKSARAFAAVDPGAPPPKPVGSGAVFALLLVAIVFAALVENLALRVAVPAGLVTLAIGIVLRGSRRPSSAKRPPRGIAVDARGLFFQSADGPPQRVVPLSEPFGLTLVASPERDRMVAVWSSTKGLFYVGSTFETAACRSLGTLFERAFTAVGDEAALQAIGPDGAPLDLLPSDFAALVCAVEELDPACIERVVLSDARGAPLLLDGRELILGDRSFDLSAPLEWRPFVFQEAFGHAFAVYQGTSIHQGSSEAVLVSLLPSLLPFDLGAEQKPQLDRRLLRDLRLMQAPLEEPPPRDTRVAIDRLFVLPVRSALDRAPRATQQPARARA